MRRDNTATVHGESKAIVQIKDQPSCLVSQTARLKHKEDPAPRAANKSPSRVW